MIQHSKNSGYTCRVLFLCRTVAADVVTSHVRSPHRLHEIGMLKVSMSVFISFSRRESWSLSNNSTILDVA